MAHKLPDEILKEIISPVLQVEDSLFADPSLKSPFSLRNYSNSAVLVVCKRWLRIATPLLYYVVVLRSTAQAQALARALKKTDELGRFIRKLRLEGGFGASVEKIILAAPNITDLFLSLAIWSDDSVTGLCRGLPSMNPSRVIIRDCGGRRNTQIRRLHTTLNECISTWSNMKTFDISSEFAPRACTFEMLKKSPSVEKISISTYCFLEFALPAIADIPSLKVIELKTRSLDPFITRIVETHPKLPTLVRCLASPSGLSKVPLVSNNPSLPNPLYVPMAHAPPDVQNKIWSRVLEYAIDTGFCDTPFCRRRSEHNSTRAFLPLVSKNFQRISIRFIYRHPVISRPVALALLANRLVGNPALGWYMRTFALHANAHHSKIVEYTDKIFSLTTGLVRVYGETSGFYVQPIKTSWDGFRTLAHYSGHTLLELNHTEVMMPTVLPQLPSVFNSFIKLRSLHWCCRTPFNDFNPKLTTSTCLPALEFIHFVQYDKSFATILSYMDLPSLSRVVFGQSALSATFFLLKHGPKIRELEYLNCENVPPILGLCPNMTLLTLGSWSSPMPDTNLFRSAISFLSLVKIKLNMNIDRHSGNNFFGTIDLSSFPALLEIQSKTCTWPTNEREIAKDFWHEWAESLLMQGIKLTDAEGVHWRPRLKTRR